MPKAKICKTCQYFEQIQGLFGKCTSSDLVYEGRVLDRLLEKECAFATNPACDQYNPIDANPRLAPDRQNSVHPGFIPFFQALGFPSYEMPSVSARFVEDMEPKPQEPQTVSEWINPIFRRKYPVQKVIKIAKGSDGKMRRMP